MGEGGRRKVTDPERVILRPRKTTKVSDRVVQGRQRLLTDEEGCGES